MQGSTSRRTSSQKMCNRKDHASQHVVTTLTIQSTELAKVVVLHKIGALVTDAYLYRNNIRTVLIFPHTLITMYNLYITLQVTMVSPYPPSKINKNVHDIVVPQGAYETMIVNVSAFTNRYATATATTVNAITKCSDSLASANVQALFKEKFDVVLMAAFLADCYLSLVYKLQVMYYLNKSPLQHYDVEKLFRSISTCT